mmetsp:Transcript_85838/g.195690  ORF Transcript_85838/g.195690 Transcript_85838/m.195690 type:complete len:421 (+) Transcript_85838:1-1263(+)
MLPLRVAAMAASAGFQGDWSDGSRQISISGEDGELVVQFTHSQSRPVADLSVANVKLTPPRGGKRYLEFDVLFPPDQSNPQGKAHWKMDSGGRVETLAAGQRGEIRMNRTEACESAEDEEEEGDEEYESANGGESEEKQEEAEEDDGDVEVGYEEWNKVVGLWEDEHRGIQIHGPRTFPEVRFTHSKFRAVKDLHVTEVKALRAPTGKAAVTFRVSFPATPGGPATESAVWLVDADGTRVVHAGGRRVQDVLTRPRPRRRERDTMSMMLMTRAASKAVGLRHDLPPYAAGDWCLPILHTEAALRQGTDYLAQTASYYDAGSPPPPELCDAVEQQALRAHGLDPTPEWVEAYRFAARMLSKQERAEVFFLRANDELFRPGVELAGRRMTGAACRVMDGAPVEMQEVLAALPRALLVASTSS